MKLPLNLAATFLLPALAHGASDGVKLMFTSPCYCYGPDSSYSNRAIVTSKNTQVESFAIAADWGAETIYYDNVTLQPEQSFELEYRFPGDGVYTPGRATITNLRTSQTAEYEIACNSPWRVIQGSCFTSQEDPLDNIMIHRECKYCHDETDIIDDTVSLINNGQIKLSLIVEAYLGEDGPSKTLVTLGPMDQYLLNYTATAPTHHILLTNTETGYVTHVARQCDRSFQADSCSSTGTVTSGAWQATTVSALVLGGVASAVAGLL